MNRRNFFHALGVAAGASAMPFTICSKVEHDAMSTDLYRYFADEAGRLLAESMDKHILKGLGVAAPRGVIRA